MSLLAKDNLMDGLTVNYINKKAKAVQAAVSVHAYERFCQRYPLVRRVPANTDMRELFVEVFNKSVRKINLTNTERRRMNSYNGETLYHRTSGVTFVIQNAVIVTVEISDKNKRYLNKAGKL